MGKYLLAPPLAEGTEAVAAERHQASVPFSQQVMPLPVSTLPTPSVSQDPPGHVLGRGRVAAAEKFGDELAQAQAQALVAGGGGGGMGVILAG